MLQVHHKKFKKKKNHNGVNLGKSYRYTSIQAADSTINMKSNELRVIIHF